MRIFRKNRRASVLIIFGLLLPLFPKLFEFLFRDFATAELITGQIVPFVALVMTTVGIILLARQQPSRTATPLYSIAILGFAVGIAMQLVGISNWLQFYKGMGFIAPGTIHDIRTVTYIINIAIALIFVALIFLHKSKHARIGAGIIAGALFAGTIYKRFLLTAFYSRVNVMADFDEISYEAAQWIILAGMTGALLLFAGGMLFGWWLYISGVSDEASVTTESCENGKTAP